MASAIISTPQKPPPPSVDIAATAIVAPSAETLRAELKAWEKNFAIAHEGRKPGRNDIKAEPSIGASRTHSLQTPTNAGV